MASPARDGEMSFSVELFSWQNFAGSANNLVNGHLKEKKKQMVAAVKLQISTPRSKLREHYLLSRMVLDPIAISSNAYPVHSMVKNSKENQNYTYDCIGSIELPLAATDPVSIKKMREKKQVGYQTSCLFCTKHGKQS